MGLGWMHLTVDGQAAVYHRGDWPGYHSDALCIPSLGFAVAGFTNGGPAGPRLLRDLRRHVLAHAAGLEQTDPAPDTSTNALGTAESVVGTYDAWQAVVHVERSTQDGQLRLRLEPRPPEPGRYQPPPAPDITLAPLDAHRLIINDPKLTAHGHPIDILRDPDGAVTAIRWNLRLCPRRPDTPNTTRWRTIVSPGSSTTGLTGGGTGHRVRGIQDSSLGHLGSRGSSRRQCQTPTAVTGPASRLPSCRRRRYAWPRATSVTAAEGVELRCSCG